MRRSKEDTCNDGDEMKEIPEFMKKEVQAAIDSLKKEKQVTAMESELKTSKHVTMRRKK